MMPRKENNFLNISKYRSLFQKNIAIFPLKAEENIFAIYGIQNAFKEFITYKHLMFVFQSNRALNVGLLYTIFSYGHISGEQ